MTDETKSRSRLWIASAFTIVEDVVYIGLGLILAATGVALLVSVVYTFAQNLAAGTLAMNVVALLDRILLILLVVELLYTVQVSFREHTVEPEPFLLVGVIAVIRRVLVLTAEFGHVPGGSAEVFERSMVELGVLTILIFVLVFSLTLLRKRHIVAQRA